MVQKGLVSEKSGTVRGKEILVEEILEFLVVALGIFFLVLPMVPLDATSKRMQNGMY